MQAGCRGLGYWRIGCWLGIASAGCSSVVMESDEGDGPPMAPELGIAQQPLSVDQIRVSRGIQDVSGAGLPTDRPELSPSGDQLVYTVEEASTPVFILSTYLAKSQNGRFSPPQLVSSGSDGVHSGQLVSWFFPAFTPTGNRLITGKGTIDRLPNGELDLLSLYASFVETTKDGTELETLATAAELGFVLGEIPQGARYSPCGPWIAFFAQLTEETRGLYIYHPELDELTRVTSGPDRDPVWSSDGRQLFFYEQTEASAAHSALGVVDLEFDGPHLASASRHLFDAGLDGVTHQEHPAPVADSDVVFLHELTSADDTPHLAVRRSCPGFTPLPLQLIFDRREIVDAVRPATASESPALTFMGRFSSDDSYRIFSLSPKQGRRIARGVEALPCP